MTDAEAIDYAITPSEPGKARRRAVSAQTVSAIDQMLLSKGRALLRGFDIQGTADFARLVKDISGENLLDYSERTTPRKQLEEGVYTSTEYSAEEEIFFHNENSYQRSWPARLFFYCEQPASVGGATPLADVRAVTRSIDKHVVDEFRARGWRHVRNYHDGFGLPWTEVFGNTDRNAVERYCSENGIRAEWGAGGSLRTEADRQALHKHPTTGEELWFNHVAFFHWSSLPGRALDVLTQLFGVSGLPNNTLYGDGEPVPEDICAHIRDQYRAAATRFDYERGDVLIVDNMYTAHGREPFQGDRRIAVAMTGAKS